MAIAGIPIVAGRSAARSRRRRASEEGGGARDREQQLRHRRERCVWPFGGLRAAGMSVLELELEHELELDLVGVRR